MTYFNPVFSYGLDKFCRACVAAGIDGLIIPDLPPEEGVPLECAAGEQGLDLIYLLSPTSTAERIRMVADKSRGYIYLVSVTGVTGARSSLPSRTGSLRRQSPPGCQTTALRRFRHFESGQAKQIAGLADGVIVGSRLIQLMKEDAIVKQPANFHERDEGSNLKYKGRRLAHSVCK